MALPAENKISSRRGKKSAAAFRTISEVAAELDLPQHVLRFWETKFPSVKPLKRGGGRRYYRPEDIALLKHIRNLLYVEGYTIKGVQKLLNKSAASIIAQDAKANDAKALDDGNGEAASKTATIATVTPAPSAATANPDPLGPEMRKSLEGLLAELEELRALLRGLSR